MKDTRHCPPFATKSCDLPVLYLPDYRAMGNSTSVIDVRNDVAWDGALKRHLRVVIFIKKRGMIKPAAVSFGICITMAVEAVRGRGNLICLGKMSVHPRPGIRNFLLRHILV